MFIELDKYCWNSLRKGRLAAFQNDIQQTFTVFNNHMLQPQSICIKEFTSIVQKSQFMFIVHCRAQQQDEEEYIQLLYQILVQNYFMTKNPTKQIFSLYSLYFVYCQLQRKRKINVDMDFLDQFLDFLNKNSSKSQKHYMMIAKKLFENCLNIGIKNGLKTYLIKPNGQAARKGRYTNQGGIKKNETKKEQFQSQRQESLNFVNNFKIQIQGLEINLDSYTKGKQRFNSQLQSSENKLLYSDKNLGIRLKKLYNAYDQLHGQKFQSDQ